MSSYCVRGGSTVGFNKTGAKTDWEDIVLPKVTYFSEDEVVKKPSEEGWPGPRRWVFFRDGGFWRVTEEMFMYTPERKAEGLIRDLVREHLKTLR